MTDRVPDHTGTGPRLTGRRRARVLATLGALTAFGPLSLDLYLPALPELGRDLGAGEALTQLTMSLCMVGLAAGQLLAGPLSDRVGRRRPLVAGVAAYTVISVLCALAPTIWALAGLRLLQGLAGAAGIVVARAIVRDLFGGAEAARAYALLMLVMGTAPVLAPLAGGQLARFGDWRVMFAALAVAGALLTAAALTLPETLPPGARVAGGAAVGQGFAALARDRSFAGYALVLALGACALFTYISFSPFVLQDGYGLTPQAFSAVFAANALGIVAGGNVSRLVVRRAGARRTLGAGLLTALAGSAVLLAALAAGLQALWLLAGLFLVISSVGLILPNATALALEPHGERAGTASALLGAVQFLAGAAVPPLASLGGATATAMAVTMAACVVAALPCFTFLAGRTPRAGP